MNPLALLWQSYSKSLQLRPLPTKITAAVLIFTTSDLATQYITRENDKGGSEIESDDARQFVPNYQRSLSGATFGVLGTIYLHYWWNYLETIVEVRVPASRGKLANTLTKVVIDQGFSAPLYNWAYFFITNFVHEKGEKKSFNVQDRAGSAARRASDMIWPLMMQHWKVWPPIHFANFYFTPLPNRVLVQNFVLVGWSGYLSHLNHSEEEELRGPTAGGEPGAGRPMRLKRRKTVITGIDVVEEEEEE